MLTIFKTLLEGDFLGKNIFLELPNQETFFLIKTSCPMMMLMMIMIMIMMMTPTTIITTAKTTTKNTMKTNTTKKTTPKTTAFIYFLLLYPHFKRLNGSLYEIFNRPGEAGAVLQTPL